MARMTKADRAEQARHVAMLRDMLPPGATVYTRIEHVSRSGMSRDVRVYAVRDGGIESITGLVASALDMPRRDARGDWVLRVGGCGFDAGFSVVYDLASTLYPNGFGCIGRVGDTWCPSNDHANGDRDYTPHGGTCPVQGDCDCDPVPNSPTDAESVGHGHWHRSGGYALRHGRL